MVETNKMIIRIGAKLELTFIELYVLKTKQLPKIAWLMNRRTRIQICLQWPTL